MQDQLIWRMIGVVFLCLMTANSSAATETSSESSSDADGGFKVETFTPPKSIELKTPVYPGNARQRGQEGWVELTFMVDPNGRTYDVAVVDSSGGPSFEKAALRSVDQWQYEPASLDGVPIDAGMHYKIAFALEGNTGARRSFRRAYGNLQSAIKDRDREEADKQLARLQSMDRNLYEEAYLNLSLFNYYLIWGDVAQRYAALNRATFVDRGQEFLPPDVMTPLLTNRFSLELQQQAYSRALKTSEELLPRDLDDVTREKIESRVAAIHRLIESDQPIARVGTIGAGNDFHHVLLRPKFRFEGIEGDIAELRLHCDKEYVGFIYESDTTYTINSKLQDCNMRVIGNPGTTFTLVEMPGTQGSSVSIPQVEANGY